VRPARPRGDRATGVLSTTFGIGVFLALLGFSAHILLNLFVISTVDDIAQSAATEVAVSGAEPGTMAMVEARALSNARSQLGAWAAKVTLTFEHDPTERTVILHVTSAQLRLLPRFAGVDPGPPSLDRRIVVHRENTAP
jgi:hypothetical protein